MASTTGLGWRRWGGRRAHGQRRPFPSYRVRDQHQAPWGPPGKGDLGAWRTCCWRDWKGGRFHGVLGHPWDRLLRLCCGSGRLLAVLVHPRDRLQHVVWRRGRGHTDHCPRQRQGEETVR
jgi:hypothetical protein